MDLNEAQTRALRIDAQLSQASWEGVGIDFESEYEVASAGEPEHGFADYLLTDSSTRPLAIVEAKRSSRDAIVGKKQAEDYADAIEARTGARPFIFLANGDEIWFWDRTTNPRMISGFLTREDLLRRSFQSTHRIALNQTSVNPRIANREYQRDAIRAAQNVFSQGRRRALWVMATGSGKTRTAAALIDTMLQARWIQRVLFLVDRTTLREQAAEALAEHLPAEPSMELTSSTYDPNKHLYVATLQTMQDFHREFSPGAFDLVVSDEAHRSIYNKWEDIITYFDALLLGLTATPADYIERNTFAFFDCEGRTPTFDYPLEQAVEEGYLVPFRAYHARTRFQVEGIRGSLLPADVQQKLISEGIDPEDLDFEGTEIEKKVTNRDTTRKLVGEFFERAVKEPDGVLPGKSIVFALSQAHAKRIWKTFNDMYPQYPGMTELIHSNIERADALIRQFKNESMPRIAISVDMLDTGVDIPTVVNLAFMKPVYSKIKFWQMVGRGTRVVGEEDVKPWCPIGVKDHFLILDFWENFEFFNLNPEGTEPASSSPLTVRYFRSLVSLVERSAGRKPRIHDEAAAELRRIIDSLPIESAGVREYRQMIEEVQRPVFWSSLDPGRVRILRFEVAPLMRYLGEVDLARLGFANRCATYIAALMDHDLRLGEATAKQLRADILSLPATHPRLSGHRSVIEDAAAPGWADGLSIESVWRLKADLSDLMRLRKPQPSFVIALDLDDAMKEQRWVTVGPEATEYELEGYREKVEDWLRSLVASESIMQKVAEGLVLDAWDMATLERLLNKPDLFVTETSLRSLYRAPRASLIELLRHSLGVKSLPSTSERITHAFDAFAAQRGYLHPGQLMFVRLFAQRLAAAGRIEMADLYESPFAQFGDLSQHFGPEELSELLSLASEFETR